MNPDQLAPGERSGVDLEPQLRGPAGQGRPHPPGLAAGRRRHRRPRHASPRRPADPGTELTQPSTDRRLPTMEAFTTHTGVGSPAAPSATSTPTRSSRPSTSSGSPAPDSRTACSPPGATTRRSCSTTPPYDQGSVLVAGPDFGTGSSREHAVWALIGLRLPGGHLVAVRRHLPRQLRQGRAAGRPGRPSTTSSCCGSCWRTQPGHEVDGRPRAAHGHRRNHGCRSTIDDYTRWRLLEGLDDIGLTLRQVDAISEFEKARPSWKPRTLPAP